MVLPLSGERLHQIAALAKKGGAVFIMDEVKTGFRSQQRSISALFGLTPDMITISKAMGNGWSVAALLGNRDVLEYGNDLHLSGTFHGDIGAMAASLATIAIIEQESAADHANRIGTSLLDGLSEAAAAHGVPVDAYPEPIAAMPFMKFVHNDPLTKQRLTDTFYREMLTSGILLHPRHLWFPSLAHTDADVDRTLEAADAALKTVSRLL
jgi:glutamate-1-semialdehyde aminotransferase